jgi:hypothetical protein
VGRGVGIYNSPDRVNLQHAEGKKYSRYFGNFERYAKQTAAENSNFDTPR